ncbi:hypothetical protein PR048_012804 [Dryococelus australis]|uniref:Uncharacterized protein n=1 Tax=Dryococelus australis TaxID=614101 RepID=A0ABQ9HQC9_9NEOP|nr:hypothetical protein PR048_012804 [Dryococelus australis]
MAWRKNIAHSVSGQKKVENKQYLMLVTRTGAPNKARQAWRLQSSQRGFGIVKQCTVNPYKYIPVKEIEYRTTTCCKIIAIKYVRWCKQVTKVAIQ